MRALEPTLSGSALNPHDGVRSAYEVFGPLDAPATVVLLPTWSIIHSRIWKFQAPVFARWGLRVITFDGRGNGRSDRPPRGYAVGDYVADVLAVLDALAIARAALVGFSAGGRWGIEFAARYPERVTRLLLVAPDTSFNVPLSDAVLAEFLAEPPAGTDPPPWSAASFRRDYPAFLEWFFHRVFNEPHSTKAIDDCISWGMETDGETMIATQVDRAGEDTARFLSQVRCPVLIVHGMNDAETPVGIGKAIHAALPQSQLLLIEGAGHATHVRDPVHFNLAAREFLAPELPLPPERHWTRAMARRTKRALFVSSPIGLGHAQRDVAIARELRARVPGLEIDWLAQDPVTGCLKRPASASTPSAAS